MKFKKYIAIVMATVSLTLLNTVSPVAAANVNAAQAKTEETVKDSTQEKEVQQGQQTTGQAKAEQTTEQTEQTTEQTEQTTAQAENTTEQTEQAAEQTQQEQTQTEEQPVLTEEEQAAKEKEEARKALQDDPNHVHHFKWIAKMNESEVADGTLNYMCDECGKIWFFSPASPYVCFQGDIAHRIETAAEGEQVKVKTSHFINFDKQVMKALADRPDVSLYVSFLDGEYKGNRVSFVIPAGEDTVSLLDENGYCGFRFLGNKYGLTLEQAAEVSQPAEGEQEQAAESIENSDNTGDSEKAEGSASEGEKTETQVG